MSNDTNFKASSSGGDEISDSELARQLSLEEQIIRLQRIVAYLIEKNEKLRQSLHLDGPSRV
jgi:hypothetical protein